jgi:hypothetical protein
MMTVECTVTCDICDGVITETRYEYAAGSVIPNPDIPRNGTTQWKHVCDGCFETLHKAFWALKVAADAGK